MNDESSINPYATTNVDPFVVDDSSDEETIRRKYLNHEASVKSIGSLYLLGAIFLVPLGTFVLGAIVMELLAGDVILAEVLGAALVGLLYLGLGLLQGFTGLGLRKLRSWSRIPGIVFSVIGLIGFPIGTLISSYFIYALASGKGAYVLSSEYEQVIAATPEIKYRTSIVVWIALILLVCLFGIGLVGFLGLMGSG